MSATTDRLASLARAAEEATDALDLRDAERALARLRREPERVTTELGRALVLIAAERKAAERAARAAELRSFSTLADAEAHAAANSRSTR